MIATEYVTATGELLGKFWGDNLTDIQAQCLSGRSAIEGDYDPATQYVSGGVITTRPTYSYTKSGLTITAHPTVCDVWIEGVKYANNSTANIAIDFSVNGTYSVTVKSFPHQDWTTSMTQ